MLQLGQDPCRGQLENPSTAVLCLGFKFVDCVHGVQSSLD